MFRFSRNTIFDVMLQNALIKNVDFVDIMNLQNLHWISCIPVKVRENVVSKDQRTSEIRNNFIKLTFKKNKLSKA